MRDDMEFMPTDDLDDAEVEADEATDEGPEAGALHELNEEGLADELVDEAASEGFGDDLDEDHLEATLDRERGGRPSHEEHEDDVSLVVRRQMGLVGSGGEGTSRAQPAAAHPHAKGAPEVDEAWARQRLTEERSRLKRLVAAVHAAQSTTESEAEDLSEMAPASQHFADLGSETVEREEALSQLEDLRTELAELEAAEAKIDAGTYGLCEFDGEPIPAERLDIMPLARYCVRHEERAEFMR